MRHRAGWITAALLAAAALGATARTAGPRFFPDDPLAREPETQDASKVQSAEVGLLYDLLFGLFVTGRSETGHGLRAQNLNTIDEVPDSSWFTNRIGVRPLTLDELRSGPNTGAPPASGTWTVTREKAAGYAPGFTARDGSGDTWFLSFDPPAHPESASAALIVATKLFHALGYNQVEYFLTSITPAAIRLDGGATMRRPNGKRTPFTNDDMNAVLDRSAKGPDGRYRAAAGRLLPGRIVGPFRYDGTRPDDPNDIVPHQHRRELRALRVFGAWTNLTDMKAGNTLDAVVPGDGKSVVRHYLQDVGSTFGIGANGPHDWDEGWEYTYDGPPALKRFLSFGLAFSPWQTADYQVLPAIGRFEGDAFDPETWKPHVPSVAYLEMRDDDAFWAARRVMAFSDEQIRAIASTGGFSDPRAEKLLADVLIKRRDKIGRAYLTKINPIVDPVLDANGTLTVGNAAVQHRFADPPAGYLAVWSRFDNASGATAPLGESTSVSTTLTGPATLPSDTGAIVQVDVSADAPAHPSWKQPVRLHFRRQASGWQLVGLDRLPHLQPAAAK